MPDLINIFDTAEMFRYGFLKTDEKGQYLECPYCLGKARKGPNAIVYAGRTYGNGIAWICENFPSCDSYVGAHTDTELPFGRCANQELREAKGMVHAEFDPLWKRYGYSRAGAYEILHQLTGLPSKFRHIGLFSLEQCKFATSRIRKWKIINLNENVR